MNATIITITSGKGGVGKTTSTANLGVALAAAGRRVVCLDADIGLRNLDVVMGLENRVRHDLVDVVEGRCSLDEAMIEDRRLPGLFLLPAAQHRNKTAIAPSDMTVLCAQLRPLADFVLIDSPAGIERGFHFAVAPADRIVLVTNPEVAAMRDAGRVIGLITADLKGPAQLILNRVRADLVRRGQMLEPSRVADLLSIELLGVVPEDEQVVASGNRGAPIAMNGRSPAGEAYRRIARRLQGEQVSLALSERLAQALRFAS